MGRAPFGVILLILVVSFPTSANVVATIVPGDSVAGDLGEGETDRLMFVVTSPASVTAKLKANGSLQVALKLLGPDGLEVPLGDALKGSPGDKPAVKKAPLLVLGTHTLVVEHHAGAGEYALRLKLGRLKRAKLDLREAGTERGTILIEGRSVRFDPAGTSLSAKDAQGALSELDGRAVTMDAAIDAHDTKLGAQAAEIGSLQSVSSSHASRATALEARSTNLEDGAVDLDSRLTQVEGDLGKAVGSLRVLAATESPLIFDATFVTVPTDRYVVKRGDVLSLTVGPGETEETLLAQVTMRFTAEYLTDRREAASTNLVWAEVGSTVVYFAGRVTATNLNSTDLSVIGCSPSSNLNPTGTYFLLYNPSEAERASGFTINILAGAWANPSVNWSSHRLEIDSAVLLGR